LLKYKRKSNSILAQKRGISSILKYKTLYIMLIPGILHYIIFRYLPLTGILIAFKDFDLYAGIWKSPWVGLENFKNVVSSPDFLLLIKNTLSLGFFTLLFTQPIPILFSIALSEARGRKFKKIVQSVSYFPSLLSVIVISSLLIDILSPTTGIVNTVLKNIGLPTNYFIIDPKWFRTIYVGSEVWQKFGYNAIIYFSALSSIDSQLYEAAELDGCNRLRCIYHVTLPGILPTVCTMFILNAGNIFKIGADKILLLYNPMTYSVADIFGTYVYRKGILESSYSYAAAAGLFEAVIAFGFVIAANKISKRFTENSLW